MLQLESFNLVMSSFSFWQGTKNITRRLVPISCQVIAQSDMSACAHAQAGTSKVKDKWQFPDEKIESRAYYCHNVFIVLQYAT